MTTHHISKGFDLRMAGTAEPRRIDAAEPPTVASKPLDFPGIKPKILVAKGDEVATGQPLFFDKNDPDVLFASPGTGVVREIIIGARRFPRAVVVERSGDERFHDAGTPNYRDRDALVLGLKAAGLWPLLRQRPLGKIARSHVTPVAIYVNGMDTEPLAADPAFAIQGREADLQLALEALGTLSSGKVYLTVAAGAEQAFGQLAGVEIHSFQGPHPAGLVGTHIRWIQPLRDGETAWYLKVQEAVLIGEWLRTGRYPSHRVVAVAGTKVRERAYFRVRQGAALSVLTGGEPLGPSVRVVHGTPLNGLAALPGGHLGFYATTLTCMADGATERDLFGWALPMFGKRSASRSVFSWLLPKKEYEYDARLNGGHRPIVNLGQMEAVMPLDIYPTCLIRAVQAGDLEEALSLGLLEVTEEDMALCTFVDPCKQDVGAVIRQGLDLYEKES